MSIGIKFSVKPKELKITLPSGTSYYATEVEVIYLCDVLADSFPDLMRQALTRIEQIRGYQNSYHGVGTPGGLR